jgi:hypothetical protein
LPPNFGKAVFGSTLRTPALSQPVTGHRGRQTIPQSAAEAVRLALSDDNDETGGYFATGGRLPW